MKNLFLAIASILVLTSCDSNFVYGEDKDLPKEGWHQDSVLVFKTDSLIDLPEIIAIGFNIRNNTDYYYRNMYLFCEIQVPGRDEPLRDTIDHSLMTADGYWAEGVEGASIKESTAYYKYAIKTPEKGVYTIKVQQGMRDVVLKDVVSVGARIEKLEQ